MNKSIISSRALLKDPISNLFDSDQTFASCLYPKALKKIMAIGVAVIIPLALTLLTAHSAKARPLYQGENDNTNRLLTMNLSLRSTAAGSPWVERAEHDISNFLMTVQNDGQLGPDMYLGNGINGLAGWMEFPRNIDNFYPTPRLVVGGVVEKDTLVTQATERATEWWPADLTSQIANDEQIQIFSINDTGSVALKARSEQDISFVYYDTLSDPAITGIDDFTNRPHIPLNLRVKQTSYAWSFEFAEDFIIIDYTITNVGTKLIKDAWIGLKIRGGWDLELVSGYLPTAPAVSLRPTACEYVDSVKLFWCADSDGNPDPAGGFSPSSASAVVAVKILRLPDGADNMTWNWWDDAHGTAEDWGPRKAATNDKPLRDFGGFHGEPFGDKNTYALMSNGEVDYDQFYTDIDQSDSGWILPPSFSLSLSFGPGWGNHNHNHSFPSFGPIDIPAGATVPVTIALVAGENFHQNDENNFDSKDPAAYYDELHFDDLVLNSSWASWVFDNPGIDSDPTDDDDYRGEFRVCSIDSGMIHDTTLIIDTTIIPPDTTIDTTITVDIYFGPLNADTVYYTGDGIPDFRAAAPPPPPTVRFIPTEGQIDIEWNGVLSETTPDVFSQEIDFEGYRVYLGLAARRSDMIVQTSYDLEDYSQKFLHPGTGNWIILRKPFTLEEARAAYAPGNPNWHPLNNGIDNPLFVGDSIFYFNTQDWNFDDLTDPEGIQKIYPNAPYPHTLTLDSAYADELTPDGNFFKYFEYRFTLRNLLPSQKYYAAVTAFDYGSQAGSLPFLETSPVTSAVEMFAMDRVAQDPVGGLDVVVYPNPYRADASYRELGFEGRGEESRSDERTRAVNFAHLPPVCTIRIFSLDGDLVAQFEHDQQPGNATAMHESWDLITRNNQLAVSGIYYWSVETPSGQAQIGKIVLIL